MIQFLIRRLAGALGETTTFRLLHTKLDKIMADITYTQADFDTAVADLKQAIGDAAMRAHDQLAALNQSSPSFNADVQGIKDALVQLAAIAPNSATVTSAGTSTVDKAAPNADVKDGETLDAHPELKGPDADNAADQTENSPETQKASNDK